MKITMIQNVYIEGENFPRQWQKEIESSIIPHVGDNVGDSLWNDPYNYEVIGVTIQYSENECYIYLEQYEYTIPCERKDEFAKIANAHGWKVSWNSYK